MTRELAVVEREGTRCDCRLGGGCEDEFIPDMMSEFSVSGLSK